MNLLNYLRLKKYTLINFLFAFLFLFICFNGYANIISYHNGRIETEEFINNNLVKTTRNAIVWPLKDIIKGKIPYSQKYHYLNAQFFLYNFKYSLISSPAIIEATELLNQQSYDLKWDILGIYEKKYWDAEYDSIRFKPLLDKVVLDGNMGLMATNTSDTDIFILNRINDIRVWINGSETPIYAIKYYKVNTFTENNQVASVNNIFDNIKIGKPFILEINTPHNSKNIIVKLSSTNLIKLLKEPSTNIQNSSVVKHNKEVKSLINKLKKEAIYEYVYTSISLILTILLMLFIAIKMYRIIKDRIKDLKIKKVKMPNISNYMNGKPKFSPSEELKKWKELMDDNVITEEEFLVIKKKLTDDAKI